MAFHSTSETRSNPSSADAAPPPSPLGVIPTNTTLNSTSVLPVKPEDTVYLDTATGDLIVVPAADITAFQNECRRWSYAIADFQAANQEVARLQDEVDRTLASGKQDMQTKFLLDQLDEMLDAAFTWQETAHGKVQENLKALASTDGAVKNLAELIPVLSDNRSASGSTTPGKGSASLDKLSYVKSGKGGLGIQDKVYDLPEKLVYARKDRFKPAWPIYKDKDAPTKWTEVLAKDIKTGQRKIDREKLRKAVGERLKKVKLETKSLKDLKFETVGGLTDWADAWNKSGKGVSTTTGKMAVGGFTGDIDLSSEGQLMRYMMGASLNATFEPFNKGVGVKAEGSAECALAEAKAKAELHMPSRDGWMWSYTDSKGLPVDLGAVKCVLSIELKGIIGASIAGELALTIESKDIQGKLPRMKGRPCRNASLRRQRRKAALNGTEAVKEEGAAAELKVFAGASGGAEFQGALQWRNPEDVKKTFKSFAVVSAQPEGQLGLGAGLNASVKYLPANGTFLIVAHASLCFGVGAAGKLGAEVGIATIAEFIKWAFYQVYHTDFRKLMVIATEAYLALVRLQFYLIAKGLDYASGGVISQTDIIRQGNEVIAMFDDAIHGAAARDELAKRVLREPEALKHALPETKGQLLHILLDSNAFDVNSMKIGQGYLATQKEAVMTILKWSHTKRDLEQVLEQTCKQGQKSRWQHQKQG